MMPLFSIIILYFDIVLLYYMILGRYLRLERLFLRILIRYSGQYIYNKKPPSILP